MHTATAATNGAARRVLVVEDEGKMARLVARALAAAGFEPTIELSGLRGLEQLRAGGFSLVVLDLMLPDVDGFAVLTSSNEAAPEVPVIVLSALGDVRSKVMSLELGASDYMTKPFELAELIARVRLHTRDRRGARNRHLKCGGVTLDRQRRMVGMPGGEEIQLTTREFVLLEYLMEHQGDACTREDILAHVWGSSFDPGTNVVDVCIGRLRSKLGGACVSTVRNVGYAFVGA